VAESFCVVRCQDAGLVPEVKRRLRELAVFYAPLGLSNLEWRSAGDRLLALRLCGDTSRDQMPARRFEPSCSWSWGWGESLERRRPPLLDAADTALRALDGSVVLVEGSDRAITIATGAGMTALYTAAGDGIEAWSSHAVAASWAAFRAVSLDRRTVPELMATEFVGGSRTHLVGVHAGPSCEHIVIADSHRSARSYWSETDRWAATAEEEAQEAAEASLLKVLDRRLSSTAVPYCGLTGGYDSRVVAAACRELGYDVPCFTWGTEMTLDDPVRLADVLGLPYQRFEVQIERTVEDNIGYAEAQFRWNEGLAPALPLGPPYGQRASQRLSPALAARPAELLLPAPCQGSQRAVFASRSRPRPLCTAAGAPSTSCMSIRECAGGVGRCFRSLCRRSAPSSHPRSTVR
jgi:hypothetical protein